MLYTELAMLKVNESRIPFMMYAKKTHYYVITSASPRVAFKMQESRSLATSAAYYLKLHTVKGYKYLIKKVKVIKLIIVNRSMD